MCKNHLNVLQALQEIQGFELKTSIIYLKSKTHISTDVYYMQN